MTEWIIVIIFVGAPSFLLGRVIMKVVESGVLQVTKNPEAAKYFGIASLVITTILAGILGMLGRILYELHQLQLPG